MNNLELTTYALIADDIDNGRDYLDNFVPLLATLFSIKKMNELVSDNASITLLKKDMLEEFKLDIPTQVARSLIRRCEKLGLLEYKHNQGKYIIVEKSKDKYNFLDKRKDVTRDLNKLADSLLSFVNEKIANNKQKIELLDRDKSIEILFNVVSKNTIILDEEKQTLQTSKKYKPYELYVYQFILKIKDCNTSLYNILIKVAMGYIFSNYLLLPSEKYNASLKSSCAIFLDTPFLVGWLLEDHKNDDNEDTYKSFMDALKKEEISLKIFEHTYDEMRELFEMAKKCIDTDKFDYQASNRFMKSLYQNKYGKSDILLLDKRFTDLLDKNNIKREKNDVQKNTNLYLQFEAIFEEEAASKGIDTYHPYIRKRLERDIASLSWIYQRQPKPDKLEYIENIFVTTSYHVVQNAHRYQKEILKLNTNLSLCVTDVFLMTALWIKNNKCKDFRNFIQERFIIDCIALCDHIHEKLYYKLKEAVEKHKNITKEHALALLQTAFMNNDFLESGSHNGEFTDESVEEMISHMIKKLVADKDKEIENRDKENENLKNTITTISKENVKFKKIISQIVKVIGWVMVILIAVICFVLLKFFSDYSILIKLVIEIVVFVVSTYVLIIKKWITSKIENYLYNKWGWHT